MRGVAWALVALAFLHPVLPAAVALEASDLKDFRQGRIEITETGTVDFLARNEVNGQHGTYSYSAKFTNKWHLSNLWVSERSDGRNWVQGVAAVRAQIVGVEALETTQPGVQHSKQCSIQGADVQKSRVFGGFVQDTQVVLRLPPLSNPASGRCVHTTTVDGHPHSSTYVISGSRAAQSVLYAHTNALYHSGALDWSAVDAALHEEPGAELFLKNNDLTIHLPIDLLLTSQTVEIEDDGGARFAEHLQTFCQRLTKDMERDGGTATCKGRSQLRIETTIACQAVDEAVEASEAQARQHGSAIPVGDREGFAIASWAEKFLELVRIWLGNDRVGDVLGCPNAGAAIGTARDVMRQTLLHLKSQWNRDSVPYMWAYTTIERALAVLGHEEPMADGLSWAIEMSSGAMTAGDELWVDVGSPVALHAYDPLGRHLGWNWTTDSPDLQIPGARYNGRPHEAQNMTLSQGVYRIVVEQLGPGDFLLALRGSNSTRDPIVELLPSVPGRSSSLEVSAFRFGERAVLVASLPHDARSSQVAPTARPTPTTASDEDSPERRKASGPGTLLALVAVFVAVAAGAWARRP